MSATPPIVPTLAPCRSIMLPASYATGGVVLLILFLALMFFLYSISSGDRALFPRCRRDYDQ